MAPATDEFVLEFDDGDAEPPARVGARVRRSARSAVLWAALSVTLTVTGLAIVPPAPGEGWGVSPGWTVAPTASWSVDVDSELWRGTASVELREDRVLVATGSALAAYARTDGAQLWRVRDVRGCTLGHEPVACVRGNGADAEVVRVDAAGGSTSFAMPSAVAAAPHGAGLVVLAERRPNRYSMTSLGAGGEHLWHARFRGPWWMDQFADNDRPAPRIAAVGDVVVESVTASARDADTGGLLPGRWYHDAEHGVLITFDHDVTRVRLPGREDPVVVPGTGWPPLVHDGSASDVALVEADGGGSEAISTRSGTVLWETDGFGYALARLDGVAMVAEDGRLAGYQVRTGRLLWSWEEASVGCPCVGGPGGLVLLVQEPGTGTSLVGMHPGTGEVLWRVPTDDSVVSAADAGAVALLTPGTLSLYSRGT